MSEPASTPTEYVTAGTLFTSHNVISDHDIVNGIDVDGMVVYPLTEEQLKYKEKNEPKDTDDETVRAEKAKTYKPPVSDLYRRIKARFTDKYLNDTVALLGYQINDKYDTLIDNTGKEDGKYTINQLLNGVFKLDITQAERMFMMEQFAHRPIFCGVNVLYDVATSDEFSSTRHMSDYFNDSWKDAYNNAKYLAKDGEYEYRDLTFSSGFLGDMQNKAKKSGELVTLFVRNDFSVGLTSIDTKGLGKESDLAPQINRVFVSNYERDPSYDYTTILMPSPTMRLNPEKADTDTPYIKIANSTVLINQPGLAEKDGDKPGKNHQENKDVKYPCIIFAGETLTNPNAKQGESKGYELATFTAVPICSWTYFQSEESGFANTKAIERLKATNTCGPFTRVIANNFYSTAVSNILETYTEIELVRTFKDSDKKEPVFGFKGLKQEGDKQVEAIDWESVDVLLRTAAEKEFDNANCKKYISKNSINDLELYESAYHRDNNNNYDGSYPDHIKKMFDATILPRRFAFFRMGDDKLFIRQYPGIPILNALPMQDDYITQLVPVYKSLDEKKEGETSMDWYINPNDIFVEGVRGSFYNVAQQTYKEAEYPEYDGQGVMFTYTGHLYNGPKEGTTLPKKVKAILMSETIDTSLAYKTDPITIAPDNNLKYMIDPTQTDAGRASREAYIEFIKQGCVWADADGNEPEKSDTKTIPDTPPIGIDMNKYIEIEATTAKTPSNAPAEEESAKTNKTSLYIAIAVLVVLIALIIIFIIYRVIKKKKAAMMGISQGMFCGESP